MHKLGHTDMNFGPDPPIVQQILFLRNWLKDKGEQMVGEMKKNNC